MAKPILTLTTDFGLTDHFVGVMKGVILDICPQAQIVDISHEVAPFAIAQGAYLIAQAYPYFSKNTVHIVVVDPGVGTARRPILVEAAGQYFVAPDNGVLEIIYSREKHQVWAITDARVFRQPVSQTFHGRDIFAPAAAHLACDANPAKLGKKIIDYARSPFATPRPAGRNRWCGCVLHIDRFGNLVTNRSDGEEVDGHLRLKAARKLGINEVPVILCDEWTPAQVKAFRLMVNRSVTWASWDEELLALELQELSEADFDLDLTGFNPGEIDGLLALPDEERANATPPVPENPVSLRGDLWLCGTHRVLCGDATSADALARLLGERQPLLMVTDPPYGIELDSEWRDRAGLNGGDFGSKRTRASKARAAADRQYHAEPSYMKRRTEGQTETTISGDTRADWSEAFELLPSLQVAYVWHASVYTREVLNGLLRIGFVYPQQIIWNKGRTVLTRTHYWYSHEPAWYVRKPRAPWYGQPGENATVWDSPSPKFVMGGSEEDKFDHPTQKPVELMRRPILNHTKRGELVYDPFLGSGTTLAAAELTERVCCGMELEPKYVDVVVQSLQERL